MASVTVGDATVTAADEALLADGLWLNDVLLTFWCENAKAADDDSQGADDNVVVIPPNMTYFLLMADGDEAAAALGALRLDGRKLVVAVVNNTTSLTASGTHWSVLCYARETGSFYHYDSAAPTNRSSAKRVVEALRGPLGAEAKDAEFVNVDCPRQPNSWMCGDYTCAFVTALVADQRYRPLSARYRPPDTREALVPAAGTARTVRNIMRTRIAHLRAQKK